MQITSTQIAALIEAHAEASGLDPRTIGRRAVMSSSLYARAKAGKPLTNAVIIRLLDWLRANAPNDATISGARENSVKAVAAE